MTHHKEYNEKQNKSFLESQSEEPVITYEKLFWLFMLGSVIGVLLEGFWCLFMYDRWETHVVSIWGPFCIIYGFGAVGCYIGSVRLNNQGVVTRFIAFAVIGTVIEYVCGWVLEYGLNMRAWDYSDSFLNLNGYVTLSMTLLWGLLGVAFGRIVPKLERMLKRTSSQRWHKACVCLTIFMAVNLTATAACMARWSSRHDGIPPSNVIEQIIDRDYNDERMAKRFCEWQFIDAPEIVR